MTTPVSFIIPVYNVLDFLPQTLASILEQEGISAQIIIVNDGSTAQATTALTALCLKHPQITLLTQENQGQALARAYGVQHAAHEYTVFMDADDILAEGALSHLLRHLEDHPDAIAAYGHKTRIDAAGKRMDKHSLPRQEHISSGDILPALLRGFPLLSNGNICIKTSILQKLDFPQAIRQGEDWVTWCRLAMLGNITYAGERIVLYIRKHDQNVSGAVQANPAPLFTMLDYVFKDTEVIRRIDRKMLKQYRRHHEHHIHMSLSYVYREKKRYLKGLKHRLLASL